MYWVVYTIAWTVLAVYMAEKRGRSTVLAFVGGLAFGIFCPLYYLIVGDSKELRSLKLHAEMSQFVAKEVADAVKEKKLDESLDSEK